MATTLGHTIKALRLRLNLRQRELARQAGLSRTYLATLEKGDKPNPSKAVLERLGRVLDVHPAILMGGGTTQGGQTMRALGRDAAYRAVLNDLRCLERREKPGPTVNARRVEVRRALGRIIRAIQRRAARRGVHALHVVVRRKMRAAGVAPSVRADVLPRLVEIGVRLPKIPGLKKELPVMIRSRVRKRHAKRKEEDSRDEQARNPEGQASR